VASGCPGPHGDTGGVGEIGERRPTRARAGSPPTVLLVLVCGIVLVDTAFYTALTPLLPHLSRTYGLSKTGSGLLVAAYPIGTLIGALPSGVVANRLGVRRTVVMGLAGMSVATVTFAFVTSVALLDGARAVQGLGGMAFGAALGGALFGPVVGGVASRVGVGPTFAGAAVAGGGLMLLCMSLPKPTTPVPQRWRDVSSSLADPGLLAGMWLTALAGLALGVVEVLAPLRLSRLGASAVTISAAFLGAAAVETALSPLIGRLSDRRGHLTTLRGAVAGAIVACVALPLVSPAGALVATLVIALPSIGCLFVPASALLSERADRSGLDQGLAFGLSNLAWAGGQAVSATAGGALAQATADVVPYLVVAVVSALTLLAIGPGRHRLAALTVKPAPTPPG
jgi:MFS family permease